jgi:periplasmic protein TonB
VQIREPHFLLPESRTSARTVLGSSGVAHAAAFLMLALLLWVRPGHRVDTTDSQPVTIDLVYVPQPGTSGGGGGGGGSRSTEPPRVARTPPVKPPDPLPAPTVEPEPIHEPQLAAEAPALTAQQTMAVPGLVPDLSPESRGPGDGAGADNGRGEGVGPRDGSSAGRKPGSGVGDDDVLAVGNGVTAPLLLSRVQPKYTAEAMLKRVQGEARFNCVVLRTGRVGSCEIAQSLDQDRYGLDSEAIKAARQFQFRPATRSGDPVPVRVIIVLEFNMR